VLGPLQIFLVGTEQKKKKEEEKHSRMKKGAKKGEKN